MPDSSRLTGWKALAVWGAVPVDIAMLIGTGLASGWADGVLLAVTVLSLAVGTFAIVGALMVIRLPRNPKHLRNEVDLARIGGTLLAAANGAVTPQTASVWLRVALNQAHDGAERLHAVDPSRDAAAPA